MTCSIDLKNLPRKETLIKISILTIFHKYLTNEIKFFFNRKRITFSNHNNNLYSYNRLIYS